MSSKAKKPDLTPIAQFCADLLLVTGRKAEHDFAQWAIKNRPEWVEQLHISAEIVRMIDPDGKVHMETMIEMRSAERGERGETQDR